MVFSKLHVFWTAAKNPALPETLSSSRSLELLPRKTTVDIPQTFSNQLIKRKTEIPWYGTFFSNDV